MQIRLESIQALFRETVVRQTVSLHSVHLCMESGVILLSVELFSFQHVFKGTKGGARPLAEYIISVFLSVCHSGMMKSLECLGDI